MTFFENRHEQVNGDGDPNLYTHGVLRSAVESFDSHMLFDLFDEEFDFLTATVKLCDFERRFVENICKKHITLFGFQIAKMIRRRTSG
jgi:hypothetical protein